MIERRYINEEQIETRSEIDSSTGARVIMGYYAVKNSPSVKMTERINGELRTYTEKINPSAFDDVDLSTVFYTVEHDPSRIIARSGVNLELSFNEKGMFGKATIPDSSLATSEQENLYRNIQQGIVKGNSFAFKVAPGGDVWYRKNGELFREINKLQKIVDVTSTVMPAYSDSFVFTRSLNEADIKEIETEHKEQTQPEPIHEFDKETIELDFEMSLLKAKTF